MGRLLMGVLAGLVLGFTLGFAMFGAAASDASDGGIEPGLGPVTSAPAGTDALVADEDGVQAPRNVPITSPRSAPRLSDKRIEELARGLAQDDVPSAAGEGSITGTVLESDDQPLAGVVLHATCQDASGRTTSSKSVGRGAPELSLKESVRLAAERHHSLRALRHVARTGADGAFRFDALPEGDYRIRGYKEGYEISARDSQRWSMPTGSVVDFIAKQIVTLPIAVLMPDGTPADEAVIVCSNKNSSNRNGADSYSWSQEEPWVRLPAGAYQLEALYGLSASRSIGGQNAADMHSEKRDAELVASEEPERLVLELEGRSGIRGRVAYAGSRFSRGFARVYVLPMTGGAEVDLELLAQSDTNYGLRGASEYSFLDLAPGSYVVGVGRSWNSPIVAHQIVEVGNTILKCDLEVPALDPSDYIVVRAFGSDEKPIAGVEFSFRHWYESGSSGSGLRALTDVAGVYFLSVPNEAISAYYGEARSTKTSFTLEVRHSEFGSKFVELAYGQAEVDVNFAVPAQLEVTVSGYLGSAYIGRVTANVNKVGGDGTQFYGYESQLDANGTRSFDALEPGEYEVTLGVRAKGERRQQTDIAKELVTLRAGENSMTLAMPALHSVGVVVPDAVEGQRITLQQGHDAGRHRGRQWSADTDGSERVEFSDLPAGRYKLQASVGGSWGSMRIELPSGDIVFEADK